MFKGTLWSTQFRRLAGDMAQTVHLGSNIKEGSDHFLEPPPPGRRCRRERIRCSAPKGGIWRQEAHLGVDKGQGLPHWVRQCCVEGARRTVGNGLLLPGLSHHGLSYPALSVLRRATHRPILRGAVMPAVVRSSQREQRAVECPVRMTLSPSGRGTDVSGDLILWSLIRRISAPLHVPSRIT